MKYVICDIDRRIFVHKVGESGSDMALTTEDKDAQVFTLEEVKAFFKNQREYPWYAKNQQPKFEALELSETN